MSETVSSSPFIVMSFADHEGYGYAPEKPFEFAQAYNFIELSSAELAKLMGLMPMFFQVVKVRGQVVVRFGLATGFGQDNCLIHPNNGKFFLPYIPAALRAYPFRLLQAKKKSSEKTQEVLAVVNDVVDKSFAKGLGEALLSEGQLTEKGKGFIALLSQLNKFAAADQKANQAVLESGVLVPMNIQVKSSAESEESQTVRPDLFRVDESKLRELKSEHLKKLQTTGAMVFIYAHLFSMDKLHNLQKVVGVHAKLQKQASVEEIDFEKLFEEDDSDVLKF